MTLTNHIRYKATLAYDGTDFSGFQVQPNGRTVQGEIEKALQTINQESFIRIHPAGRTDAGAHAKGMVIHFDFPQSIPQAGLFRGLNTLIPDDISFLKLEAVEADFHARYHAKAKTYVYRVHNHSIRDPFHRNYTHQHPYPLDLEKARAALAVLVGTHDFTSFCSTKTDKEDKVRMIYDISVKRDEVTDEWLFTFHGDGFLYNMIRIIMGTVLSIADGRQEVSEMKRVLEARDRNTAGPTLSASGLCLMKVHY